MTSNSITAGLAGHRSPFCDPIARRIAARHIPGLVQPAAASDCWVESRDFGIGILEPAGSSYADYQSLADGAQSLEMIWSLRQRRFGRHVLSLGPFVEGDPSAAAVAEWVDRNGLVCRIVPVARAPILEISGSWEDYCGAKRGKFWHNLNRSERQLVSAFGPLKFSIVNSSEDILASLPDCLKLYRANWSRWTSRSYYLTETGDGLLRDLLVELAREGKAEIARLEQNGRLLAFSFGIMIDSVYYFHVFATIKEAEYERFSVGKLFLRRLLETVFARGFRAFDFMSGEEPYKFEWTRASRARDVYLVVQDAWHARLRLSFLLWARRFESSLKRNRFLRGVLRRASNLRRHEDKRVPKP